MGARLGSRTLPSIREHKFLVQIVPMLGTLGGLFLVNGIPAKGDFGWPVVVCCALLAGLGLVFPLAVLTKLVPVCCPQCSRRAYLGTGSTFFRKILAKYHYRCRSCGHAEELVFHA